MQQLPIIIAGSAFGLLAWQAIDKDGNPVTPQSLPPAGKPIIRGANSSSPTGGILANRSLSTVGVKGRSTRVVVSSVTAAGIDADSAIKQKLRELEAEAKRQYENLNEEAKLKAAQNLNQLKPSPGLTGHESWEEAAKKVGASIGAAAGSAACAAIPIPGLNAIAAATACATLGALIGGYLGDKLGKWARELYNDVTAWADEAWGDAKDTISDTAGDVLDFFGF
jgi:hypothetical protein